MKLLLFGLLLITTFGQCLFLREALIDLEVPSEASTVIAAITPLVGTAATYAYFELWLRCKQRS